MKIIADENIPFIHDFFDDIADVKTLNGRTLTHSDLVDADALIIRSVTPVTRELLEGTRIRFVGTCTIGIDHVDTDYLDEKGIAFASAPGSNADSAAQYVTSALITLSQRHKFDLADKTLGIIGYGNVGTRVAHIAQHLGMNVIANDPPLQDRGVEGLSPLEDVLDKADIITFHVPLTRSGKFPTYGMIDTNFLNRIKKDALLINSARGDLIVVDDLKDDIRQKGRLIALDVWPNEPRIDEELLSMVQLATPHIAGYSFDGKVKGTEMIHAALCKEMGLALDTISPDIETPNAIQVTGEQSIAESIQQACLQAYDITEDDRQLRALLEEAPEDQGNYFDKLRKHYPVRREFSAHSYNGPHSSEIAQLGFKID